MSHYQIRDSDAADWRHPVDHIEPEEDPINKTAEALKAVVLWLVRSENDKPKHIGARCLVLSVALGIDGIPYAEIGRRCDLTREAVRLMAKELEDTYGLRSSNSRSDTTRRRCKETRQSQLDV
jgi:hypothetical protein